jgi:hypothetical protein
MFNVPIEIDANNMVCGRTYDASCVNMKLSKLDYIQRYMSASSRATFYLPVEARTSPLTRGRSLIIVWSVGL